VLLDAVKRFSCMLKLPNMDERVMPRRFRYERLRWSVTMAVLYGLTTQQGCGGAAMGDTTAGSSWFSYFRAAGREGLLPPAARNVPSAYQSTTAAEACEVYLSGLTVLLVRGQKPLWEASLIVSLANERKSIMKVVA